MFFWRPIVEKIATLQEIEEYWDINDLADANEALDIKYIIEKQSMENINK